MMSNFADNWWAKSEEERFRFIELNYQIRDADGEIIPEWHLTIEQKEWFRAGVISPSASLIW